jgi:hemerythrin-like domain-containing protein
VKRSPALAALSRDHHEALVVARRLRSATPETADTALAGFDEYFGRRGERHFELEERVLLPVLEALTDGARFAWRIRDEHRWVRLLHAHARKLDHRVERVSRLGDVLHDHVRFEERIVFPFLEEALSRQQLEALARRLDDQG